MSSSPAIRVGGLGKAYTVRHRRHDHVTLAQSALERVRHPMLRDEREQFWALQDVEFEVDHGEVLGVIGRNGAGKSTLLKLLTRITAPTTGRIDLWGRVGSLLEVGTGFHPELTGRENIYLNGSILGMRRREIDRQFDAIVEFAGVEKFLDTPVKRYSSGMYVRLAFGVAAHLETEILLLDEVLAVGDAEFQQKCLDKVRSVAASGRTVLLVSHQRQTIADACSRVALFANGRLEGIGDPEEMLAIYELSATTDASEVRRRPGMGTGLRVREAGVTAPVFRPDEPKVVEFAIESTDPDLTACFVRVIVRNQQNETVVHCDSSSNAMRFTTDDGSVSGRFTLTTPWLLPGTYQVDLKLFDGWSWGLYDDAPGICSFTVADDSPYRGPISQVSINRDRVLADFDFEPHDPARAPSTSE